MSSDFCAVILAAGQGKRMNFTTPKVLMPLCGMTMIEHVIRNIKEAGISDICVVVSPGSTIPEALGDEYTYAVQEKALGTANAVKSAADFISAHDSKVLVMCADAPLQSGVVISQFATYCDNMGLDLGLLSARVSEPGNYGRIVRENSRLKGIVEKKDCTSEELLITEINSGTYLFDCEKLLKVLDLIENNNASGEYYLTDTVDKFLSLGYSAEALECSDEDIVRGANDLYELSLCEKVMRSRINRSFMVNGVRIIDPDNTYIDRTVQIGKGTTIWPNTLITGRTIIGNNNEIIGGRITDSVIGNNNRIESSVIESSTVRDNNQIGPMAHVRPHSEIKDDIRLGNFVEIKASNIDDGTKVSHLTYVGDARVGKHVNMGCGVVFANYDGKKKHVSTVGDNSFIGCNTNIVSPVNVGKNTLIGAGTTLTKDVEDYTLVIGRSRQQVIRKFSEDENE